MHSHGTCCLKGPVTQDRPWWVGAVRKGRKPVPTSDPEIRADLVAHVRQQIAEGTYDTPQRWEAALDRLSSVLQLS